MPARIRIRTAVPADAGEVWSLFAAHLSALGLRPDPALDADMEDFPSAYDGAGAQFLVAEAPSGELVGMAGLLDGEIRRVFVDPKWRRRGLAKRLILTLIALAGKALHEPPQERGLQSAGTQVGQGTSLRAKARPPHRSMTTEQVQREQGTCHQPRSHPGGRDRSAPPRFTKGARLRAVVSRDNEASRRIFLACGFTPTGQTPAHPLMQHCEVLERPLRQPAGSACGCRAAKPGVP